MKIQFQINSLIMSQFNAIQFSEIDNNQLETIKALTENSNLKCEKIVSELREEFDDGQIQAENLLLYLPIWDDSWEPYGNFEYLFNNKDYLEWKKIICDQYEELAIQFPKEEDKAKKRQEFYRLENTPNRLYSREDNVSFFNARIKELRKELYPYCVDNPMKGFI